MILVDHGNMVEMQPGVALVLHALILIVDVPETARSELDPLQARYCYEPETARVAQGSDHRFHHG